MSKNDKQQRKLAREAVLQALYAKHVSDEEPKKVLHDIFIRYEFDKLTKKFVEELFHSTIDFSDTKLSWVIPSFVRSDLIIPIE